MVCSEAPWERVLYLPELFHAIALFLDFQSVCTVRLLNRAIFHLCAPYFSATINFSTQSRHPDYKRALEATLENSSDLAILPRLDLVHSLRMDARPTSPTLTPLLNFCRNLRHIDIRDTYRKTTKSQSKLFYPEQKLWCTRLACSQNTNERNRLKPYPDDETPWSIYNLLPLEGSLLGQLETLHLHSEAESPLSINRLIVRIGQSSATKTLRSLSIRRPGNRTLHAVEWEVFKRCMCNMKVLEFLTLLNFEILTRKVCKILHNHSETGRSYEQDYGDVEYELRNRGGDENDDPLLDLDRVWEATSVKSLAINCKLDLELKLAVMAFFPNVEVLNIEDLGNIWEKEIDRLLFKDSAVDHGPIPFPCLRSLNIPVGSAIWGKSQLLQVWIQRQPRFQFVWVHFPCISRLGSEKQLKDLEDRSLSFKVLGLYNSHESIARKVITSALFDRLENLEINNPKLDIIGILKSVLDLSRPGLDQTDLFCRLPWLRTVSTLRLRSSPDSPFDRTRGEGWQLDLFIMRSLLQHMPQLVDFEIVNPIADLTLFDGLGRAVGRDPSYSVVSALITPVQDLSQSGLVTDIGTLEPPSCKRLENYCITERPLLRRLILQLSSAYMHPKKDEIWRAQLRYKFRFLQDLHVGA